MKIRYTLFALLLTGISFIACKDEDNCTAPDIATNIVGDWDVKISGFGITEGPFDIRFNADGTFVDPEEALIAGEINGVPLSDKNWEIDGQSVKLIASKGSSSIDYNYDIKSNECNKIVLDYEGLATLTFTR